MQYKLFMKATQLDIIIERLNDCVVQLKQSRVKYEGQKQSHEALVKEQEDIERKVEQFQSMEPLRVRHNFNLIILAIIYYWQTYSHCTHIYYTGGNS